MRLLYDARLAARGLGISTFVVELAHALVAGGEVELIWLGDPALAPAGTSSVVRVDRSPFPLLDGPAGRAFAERLSADLIHFTGNTGWGRRGPLPCVLTTHDLIFLDSGIRSRSLRQIMGHRYERLLVPQASAAADVLVVPSETVAAQVTARLRPARPPLVVHGGVSAPAQWKNADARNRDRADQAAKPPYIVAFAGRDPRKQTTEVVAAWRELAALPIRMHLLAAGGLPPGLRESLAPELAAGHVEIHPHVPREQLWSLLNRALALVYPSSNEGFGLPVLEGMAAGIPVLSGIAPVTREIGGDAIIQLDSTDVVESIVAALRRLVAHPDQVAVASLRGLARIRRFTWQATAAGYMAAYREAIERHR